MTLHNEQTIAAKQAAFGNALAKAKRMSIAEASAIYGDGFQTYKTVKDMRAKGWGLSLRFEVTVRCCGFKHHSFYYVFSHYPKMTTFFSPTTKSKGRDAQTSQPSSHSNH